MAASLIIGVVCWIIIHFVFLPYDVYWLHRFWQNRDALIISKRHPKLLASALILIWIWIIGYYTLVALVIEGYCDRWTINTINIFVVHPFLFAEIALNTTRYWLIFYAITYNYYVKTNKWRNVINPTTYSSNWFINNKDKYGNFRYLRCRVIMFTVLSYLLIVPPYILRPLVPQTHQFYILWVLALLIYILFIIIMPIALDTYMLCKVPDVEDNIGLRHELRFTITFFVLILTSTAVVTVTVSQTTGGKGHMHGTIFYLWFTLSRLMLTIRTQCHTRWPLLTFQEIIMDRFSETKQMELAHQNTLLIEGDDHELKFAVGAASNQKYIRLEMRDVLQRQKMFDAFMQQLLSEYCAECLLCIIEFIQFKEKIATDHKHNEFKSNANVSTVLALPAVCPKSAIVYQLDDSGHASEYKRVALRLYQKYIRIGAEWEINIDYQNRNRYKKMFGNEETWNSTDEYDAIDGLLKLYTLFDPCIDSMMSLMSSAFNRFKNSKQYQLLLSYQAPVLLNPMNIITSKSHY
eukprot:590232_1